MWAHSDRPRTCRPPQAQEEQRQEGRAQRHFFRYVARGLAVVGVAPFFFTQSGCARGSLKIRVGQVPMRKNMTRECLLGGGGRGRLSPLHRLPGFKAAVLVFRWQSHCRPRPGGSVPTNRQRLCVPVPPAIKKKGKELPSPKRDDNRQPTTTG